MEIKTIPIETFSSVVEMADYVLKLQANRDRWKDLAWLGYKVIHDDWEPTQFEQAYEDLCNGDR